MLSHFDLFRRRCTNAVALLVLFAVAQAATPLAAQENAETAQDALAQSIKWQRGPCKGSLGSYAEISVPEGYIFAGPDDAKKFMELTQNIPNPMTMGVLQPSGDDESWFLVFEYQDTGHVHDDEKATIDADALLKQRKESEVVANEERRKLGYSALHCKDWLMKPAYDTDTKCLAWALEIEDDGGDKACNYNLRLLGKTGVMSTTLVCNPADITGLVPQVKSLLRPTTTLPIIAMPSGERATRSLPMA